MYICSKNLVVPLLSEHLCHPKFPENIISEMANKANNNRTCKVSIWDNEFCLAEIHFIYKYRTKQARESQIGITFL